MHTRQHRSSTPSRPGPSCPALSCRAPRGALVARAFFCLLVLLLVGPALAAPRPGQVRPSPPAAGPRGDLLDLNTATPAQLISLPGMGRAYAQRVIAGRPYTAKNQLVTRGILPQAAYERIRDLVVAHRQGKS